MAERWNPLRRRLYFFVGALLGGGVALALLHPRLTTGMAPPSLWVLSMIASAVLVGAVSARYGDAFWDRLAESARWWWGGGWRER